MNNKESNLLQSLNPEQLSAVTWPNQSVLVLAGAGSGKTRVLTTRIIWLLQTHQTDIANIMAVTFTNKAAKEMSTRISAVSPFSINNNMWLGTFHGLCHRFLRIHAKEANLHNNFQIIDSQDQLSLIKRILKNLNISEEVIQAKSLQNYINNQKETGNRSHMITESDPYSLKMKNCYQEYEKICFHESLVDFAELLLKSYEILQQNDVLRQHYQNRFQHILVDEFQDTSVLQYKWLKLFSGDHGIIFAVGDDDQSIYRFRGANVGNMQKLIQDFNIDEPLRLEQNYRSVSNILEAANAVIANNTNRLGKNLRTDQIQGEKIKLIQTYSDYEEAEYIVEEIKSLQNKGMELDNIAILYRSNAQSRIIEQAFFKAQLPYKIYGGLRFYERQEIKHALAYLRLTINPNEDSALLRIINFPTRGIGLKSIENIKKTAEQKNLSLWDIVCSHATTSPKIKHFAELILKFQSYIGVLPLSQIIEKIIHESGLITYYQTQKGNQQDRIDNLEELVNAAYLFNPQEYEQETNTALNSAEIPIVAFLSNAVLESGERQASPNEKAVQMMTIHSSKGLEFDSVFLAGAEEGLFPSEYSLREPGGLEEERRLMYVAITRAKENLFISSAFQRLLHGQIHCGILSRFVEEIPKNLVHSLLEKKAIPSAYNPIVEKQICKTANATLTEEKINYDGFYIGENVIHVKFGTGVIISAMLKNNSAKLTINFGKEGIKELDTRYAKLNKK